MIDVEALVIAPLMGLACYMGYIVGLLCRHVKTKRLIEALQKAQKNREQEAISARHKDAAQASPYAQALVDRLANEAAVWHRALPRVCPLCKGPAPAGFCIDSACLEYTNWPPRRR